MKVYKKTPKMPKKTEIYTVGRVFIHQTCFRANQKEFNFDLIQQKVSKILIIKTLLHKIWIS